MRHFTSLGAFAEHLTTREAAIKLALHEGLKVVAEKVEKTAKDELGIYQQQAGPFPAWAALADSTQDDRVAHGYSPDEPLLRDGTLRDSIKHEVEGLHAIVGSQSQIAAYQEFGTSRIPPRPFIGPAAVHNEKIIKNVIAAAAMAGLTGDPLRIATSLQADYV